MDSWFALAIAIFSSMYVFLYGLTASAFAIEHRDGQFKKLARRDLTASVVSVASAWVFALNGFVEAALMSLFSLPPVLICLLMMLEKPAALKTDAKDGILDKKSLAWASIGADALHALHMRLDGLAIGFLAGQTTLGLYNRANGIVHQPVAFLQSVNNPVVERALLAQPESLHKELHRIAAGFFFFLATAWVVANTAPRWIPVVWSEAWLTSGAFMLPLVLAGGAQWLQIAAEPLLINQGLHQKRFRIRLFSLGAIVIFTVLLPLVGVLKALWILGCLQLCIGFGTAVVTFGWSQTRILMVSSGLLIVFSILFETTLTEETIIFQLQSGCALMFALYHLQSFFQLSKP
jgi:O-antigen/teichoic acid export membrane protein